MAGTKVYTLTGQPQQLLCMGMLGVAVLTCLFVLLQVDMARFGLGASTALFGVMASVMW